MPHSATPLPAKVVAIGSRQHGIVDIRGLVAVGAARSTIGGWVVAKHLFRLHRGVYSIVPPSMLTQEGRWLAAVMACGPGAALSHGPAGQLQGILERRERFALHVSVLNRRRVRLPGIVVHRPRSLDLRDTTRFRGIPTTTATRTVWDIASTSSPRPTRKAFRTAEKLKLLNRPRLTQLLEASPNRKGAATIAELLAIRSLPLTETRSWLEDLLITACADNGLPIPAVNVPLLGYEVDFLWPAARFIVEADGGDHLDPVQRDSDNSRDIVHGRAGYLIRRYSSLAMADEAAVVAEVLAILRERGPAPGQLRYSP